MQSAPLPEKTLEEAAAWIARLHADDRTAKDESDFKAWMAAGPENCRAFEIMDRGWTALGCLTQPPRQTAFRASRRQFVMASVGGSLVVGASFFALRPAGAQTYETAVGEKKHVSLDDGSRIFLNANTKLTVSLSDAARNADLLYGRANFDIAADKGRPFVVSVGDRQIISRGSRFDVGLDGDNVQVVMTRGDALFRYAGAVASPPKSLSTGDRLLSHGTSVHIDRPRIAPLVAWQTDMAIFDDDLLSDAVREMNLYSQTKLEIVDSRTGRLHLSGVYHVGDNAAFARSIAKFLPVRVSQQGDRLILQSIASNG